MKYICDKEDELFNYLRINISNKSKNNIKSLLKNECIYVNNIIITKYNYVVNSGDIISIGKAITYKDVNLKIIYEDSDIIVIDKPTKILTISNSKEKNKTLYREVSNYLKKENKKVFVIHRLDYDTSGVIMFAKNQKVQKPSGTTSIKVSKTQNAKTEINVIGLNVDEAIPIIDKFLDDCSLAKLETARIVHGKGTGKLREGIHKFLRKNQHVESFRIGTFGEGEMGVTIVTIK